MTPPPPTPMGCTVRSVKSRLFSTTGSHGSHGPDFCTPCCFELIMVGGFQGCSRGEQCNNWRCARAARKSMVIRVVCCTKSHTHVFNGAAQNPYLVPTHSSLV